MAKARKKLTRKSAILALKKIKVLILDVDGVLTDGRIFYSEGSGWGAFYNVFDGFGIRQLQKHGIEVCFISGGNFESHRKRAEALRIRHAYFGDENKLHAYEAIRKDLGVEEHECAYMGDEIFDIPVLETAGFAATPPHSPERVKRSVQYITRRAGGAGAVREVCELILESRGISIG